MNDIKRVCVFASSSDFLDKSFYDAAEELGSLLGKAGYDMVYGGSSLGLMWACAKEVKKSGCQIIGVMPERLHNMGVYTDECVELFVTPCMRSRKAKMDELSDAVVALAGGFGTLEELAEMIVQKQLGYNNKPIVILNTNGFFYKLLEFFEDIIQQKFAGEKSRGIFFAADTPGQVIDYIQNYTPENVIIGKEDIYSR